MALHYGFYCETRSPLCEGGVNCCGRLGRSLVRFLRTTVTGLRTCGFGDFFREHRPFSSLPSTLKVTFDMHHHEKRISSRVMKEEENAPFKAVVRLLRSANKHRRKTARARDVSRPSLSWGSITKSQKVTSEYFGEIHLS